VWLDHQNLNKPRTDKSGMKWNFRVWHDVFTLQRVIGVARIFFWDQRKDFTGVVQLGPDANKHVRNLHSLIEKLAADPNLRAKHQRRLRFPLDRNYAEYGMFPEEAEILGLLEAPNGRV
jgi:hypothetical protein